VSDAKVMTSTVAVIFAITWVVNNYNIQTEVHYFELNQTKLIPNRICIFQKNELKPNWNLKNLFRTSLVTKL